MEFVKLNTLKIHGVKIKDINGFFFGCLLVLIWGENTIFGYAIQVFRRLPIIGEFYLSIIPFATVILLVLSFPYLLEKIRGADIIFYSVCVLFLCVSVVALPVNAPYIEKDLWRVLGVAIPMYFIGLGYDHIKFKRAIYYTSMLGVFLTFIYQIYVLNSGRELPLDNMGAAYNVLPSLLYLVYWAFEKKKVVYWIIAVISLPIIFIFGTRGPMLACIVFFAFELFFKVFLNKSLSLKILFIGAGIAVLWLLFFSNILVQLAQFLSGKFEAYGFSTRIFDFFLEGDIAHSSGRDEIYDSAIDAIFQSPAFGYGVMGDRVVTNAVYVHNIVLEFWCQFGLVFGTLLLGVVIIIPIRALYLERQNPSVFYFILMLTCMVFTKLMLSGSYITEMYLFLLLGICMRYIRLNKRRACYESCSN